MLHYIALYSLWLLLMRNIYIPPQNYFNYANALYDQGKYTQAEMFYKKASGHKELKTNSLFNAGNAAFQQNNIEQAIHYYEQVMQWMPDDEDLWHNLEMAYNKLKVIESGSPKLKEPRKKKERPSAKKNLDLKKGLTGNDADRLLERAGATEKRYRYMLKRQQGGQKRDLSSTDIFSSSPERIFEYIREQTKASYPFRPGKSVRKKEKTNTTIDW